jgi:hypothetical protein
VEGGGQRVAGGHPPLDGDGDGLVHRQGGEQPGVLERAAQPPAGARRGAPAGHVLAGQLDLAPGGGQRAAEQVEQGGLPGTVGADHTDDLALADVERHAVDGVDAAERHRQLARPQHRRAAVGVAVAVTVAVSGAGRCGRRPFGPGPRRRAWRCRGAGLRRGAVLDRRRRAGGGAQEHRPDEVGPVEQVGGGA